MSNKIYVDNFAAPLNAALDKAKDELVERLKNRLISELDSNEAMRLNLEKSEEQRKIAIEKNAVAEEKIRTLEEKLATRGAMMLELLDSYESMKKDGKIRDKIALRIIELQQSQSPETSPSKKIGAKRRRNECDETSPIVSRVLKPRNSTVGSVKPTTSSSTAAVEHLTIESERVAETIEPRKKVSHFFTSKTENRKERYTVFGFGSINKGHLGHFGIKDGKEVKPVKLDFVDVEFVDAGMKTCTIGPNGDMFLNGVKQKRIAAGAKLATSFNGSHYVIDAAGDLWSWGNNDFGQLGHGDLTIRKTPKLIGALKGKKVKEMSTNSGGLVACVTFDNTCHVWGGCGWFAGAQLWSESTPLQLDQPIKSIAIGFRHALMIDTADDVYMMYAIRSNVSSPSVLGDAIQRSSWIKVDKLQGHAIKVQCGDCTSAILTTTGLYTMGRSIDGVTPQLLELKNVADISLKSNLILALTSNGELYAWGAHFAVKFYGDKPARVDGIEAYHIRQISAGDHYCLLLCEPKSE